MNNLFSGWVSGHCMVKSCLTFKLQIMEIFRVVNTKLWPLAAPYEGHWIMLANLYFLHPWKHITLVCFLRIIIKCVRRYLENFDGLDIDYEKLCSPKPHYVATRALKQLIYNYVPIILWKYGELKNTKSH